MAIELVSFDDLKLYLGLSKAEAEYPELTLIQESVVSAIENHVRRILTEDKYIKTKQVFNCTRMIPLDAIPIKSISSVLVEGVAITDFKIKSYGIELGVAIREAEVTVSYTGGLSEVADILKRAALLQTVYEFQNKESIGINIVNTDGGTVSKPALGLLSEVRRLLSSFIHPFPAF